MEKTDANVAWAMEQLDKFAHLQGAPATDAQIRSHAEALLRIVHDNEPVKETPGLATPENPSGFTRRADWLVQCGLDTFTRRFPAPMDFRRLYCQHWKPWDGKQDTDLLAPLGE